MAGMADSPIEWVLLSLEAGSLFDLNSGEEDADCQYGLATSF